MLNKIVFLTIFSALVNTASASAGKFTFTQENEPSPFTGTLFDPEATARLLANNKFLKEEYDLKLGFELSRQEREFNLKLDQLQITLDTQKEKYEATLELKNTEIEQLNKIIAKRPNSNTMIWGIIGGFIAGATSTVAIAQAVNK
ncbi:MAG: hypothetical protein H8E74_02230 [Gammaproteobacteria bacterium]|nr:hypothetical protein [Gammaproteobacteria bacterium]